MKKLYLCEMTATVYVVADDQYDAADIARDEGEVNVIAREVQTGHRVSPQWAHAIPYGDGISDDSPDATVSEIIEHIP